ncbi:MAG: SH3 domain-containing protein [Peptococcaceae bacterium]
MYRVKVFIPILMIALIAGILIGNSVLAGGPSPGSKEDPLVTKAFVESTLSNQVSQLQQQVVQLQAEADTLRQQVAFLEDKVGAKAPVQSQQPVQNNGGQSSNGQNSGPSQEQTDTQPQTTQKVAYVQQSNNYVNVRSGPGTNYDIVAKADKGSKMIILDEQGEWYRVKLADGRLAWVANWVVDVKEE